MSVQDAQPFPRGGAPRLYEQLSDALTQEIAAGQHRAGERLTEESVARRFRVSRGTVRKAFRSLEARRLLSQDGVRGMIVAISAPSRGLPWPASTPLAAAASWEAIYEDVSQTMIVQAAFGEWRVVETDLAQSYGVSRTVAREVLARLEHRGVLRKESGARWRLPMLTRQRLAEFYEMRRVLEPVALVQAAAHAPAELLTAMRAELAEACEETKNLGASVYDHLERRLHVELLQFADNRLLRETLQGFHALFVANSTLYRLVGTHFGREPFPQEHAAILDALCEHKPDVAATLLADHLAISLERVVARIDFMREQATIDPSPYLRSS